MAADANLIRQYLEFNPHKPGLDEVCLNVEGLPVWALIGYPQAAEGDIDLVAKDYEVPRETVESAIAFYRLHRAVIDNRIAANSGEPRDLLQRA